MTVPALILADTLRAAGRKPPLPFRVALADGRLLTVHRLLRVLPRKRLVGEADLEGRQVLAKLFVGRRGEKHWRHEAAGLEALRSAAVPTPDVLATMPLSGGGHALITAFLDPAESLAEAWERLSGRAPDDAEALGLLLPALTLVGRLHAAGLVQEDLHLGNFLRYDGRLFVVDGDAVRVMRRVGPLSRSQACANLAIFLAQLPPAWDERLSLLLPAYAAGGVPSVPSPVTLLTRIADVRGWRLRDFLGKTLRECTLFAVEQSLTRFSAVARVENEKLASLLQAPDVAISAGCVLKDGGTCTVARVTAGERALLIKRYNLKSLRHALGRLWRPSRAWHAWREGHRLRFLGIDTPEPLALIEERLGPLRRRAWLINEYCQGPSLLAHLAADSEPPVKEAEEIVKLFATLYRQRISHGDLKASNLLWDGDRVVLIDLDAVTQHRFPASHRRAWRRDRARLLRNWPPESRLHRWFDRVLPPA